MYIYIYIYRPNKKWCLETPFVCFVVFRQLLLLLLLNTSSHHNNVLPPAAPETQRGPLYLAAAAAVDL